MKQIEDRLVRGEKTLQLRRVLYVLLFHILRKQSPSTIIEKLTFPIEFPFPCQRGEKNAPLAKGALCASDQLLTEAIAAVNRTIRAGLEGDFAGLAAACAGRVIHLTVAAAAAGRALLAGCTAILAALGLIGETLFRVEFLLVGSKGEFLSAIFADDGLVAVH